MGFTPPAEGLVEVTPSAVADGPADAGEMVDVLARLEMLRLRGDRGENGDGQEREGSGHGPRNKPEVQDLNPN